MSFDRSRYPLNHRVFSGGRYLQAFDHLHDIDHFEHSILTYLGSKMPFDKGFVDHPAFPSVGTISRCTKISESTVRKKIKQLQLKGYIAIKAMRLVNRQGHFQQTSNNYRFSTQAFEVYDSVIESETHIDQLFKRAVGDSTPFASHQTSPSPGPEDPAPHATRLHSPSMPNSPTEPPKENHHTLRSSERDIPDEVQRIVEAWESVVKTPVTKFERQRFAQEFVRLRGDEYYYMDRIFLLANDPYLLGRAKSLNFLFSGFDAAKKNQKDIQSMARSALRRAETQDQLDAVIKDLPRMLAAKSLNYAGPKKSLVDYLVRDDLDKACDRLNVEGPRRLPRNLNAMKREVERLLETEIPEAIRDQILCFQKVMEKCNFGRCLQLYSNILDRL